MPEPSRGSRWLLSIVPMCHMVRTMRVLVIATNRWSSIGLLLSALSKVGFEIAVICPSKSPLVEINKLSARYKYRRSHALKSIKAAIADWSPSLLICNDDIAVRELHTIHSQACTDPGRPESTGLIKLIELSLGDRRSFAISRSKSRLISVAETLEIPCPPTVTVSSYEEIDRPLGRLPYPAMIKLDESWGGRGVRLVHNHDELLRAALELSFPHDWPKPLKHLAARAIRYLPKHWRPAFPQNLSIQRYISGRPANRAVVCWQGKILAGISVEALETDTEFGPTTLAGIIAHPKMAEAAEKIVRSQNLSGFLGFDFVIDSANRAWFLEMNPRATPSCHLRSKAPSLPAVLFLKLTGEQPNNDVRETPQDTIALFPNRLSNKPRSHPYFIDAPEGEHAFVGACHRPTFLRRISGKGVRGILSGVLSIKLVDIILLLGTNGN
jgi:hypothetical protein